MTRHRRTEHRALASAGVRRPTGFTLIELLTVIVIIIILAGILTPTVTQAIRAARAADTRARMGAVIGALTQYKLDHGYYPGQDNPSQLDNNSVTGSHLLAKALFTDKDGNFRRNAYLTFEPDMLCTVNNQADVISDAFPSPKAMCYYPSRIGQSGTSQYKPGDNDELTVSTSGFSTLIRDTRFETNGVAKPGEYLLIAPGPDRKYFTSDDVKNW